MTITRALRDAGMEVIYLGDQLPESIVQSAIQEDADVIGLSSLSGNHMVLASSVIKLLREKGAGDIPVIIGGKVPTGDVASLKKSRRPGGLRSGYAHRGGHFLHRRHRKKVNREQ